MKHFALALVLALAGCATQKLAVPNADTYGAITGVSPDDDESALYDTVDAALVKAGLARSVRDPAVLAATRARCNAMSASDEGTPPTATEAAQMMNAAGVADATYQVVDIPGAYAKHGLSDDDLKDPIKKLAGTKAPIVVGVCTLANGLNNQRYFSVTLVSRKATLAALPRSVAEGAEVKVSAAASPGVGNLAVYVLDPAGAASTLPAEGTVHAASKGRYVIEVVGKDDGYDRVLDRAAFFAGGPAEAFPPKAAEPDKKDGAPEPPKKTSADVTSLIGKIAGDLRGSPLAADAAAQKLADADAAARAVENPELGVESVEARIRAAGVTGGILLAGQVALSDLAATEDSLRTSPYFKVMAQERGSIGVAASAVAKSPGQVAYAVVMGPASAAPAAAPADVPPGAGAPAPAPGTAAPEHPAPGGAVP